MNRILTLLLLAAASIGGVRAQEAADTLAAALTAATTIADHINASGVATVSQPAKLNARLAPAGGNVADSEASAGESAAAEKPAKATGGYRIQLYSGNNARTAKNEAANRAALVDSQFPEYATYIKYDAPYWRLKAGDFRSYEDASAALSRLKAAMPAYAREMRVVRDRINLRD